MKIVFCVSDGVLDQLAIRAMISASEVYEGTSIEVISYKSALRINGGLELGNTGRIALKGLKTDDGCFNHISLDDQDIFDILPNVMNKRYEVNPDDPRCLKKKTHWDNALETGRFLGNFSDIVEYWSISNSDEDFLYLDTDIISVNRDTFSDKIVVCKDHGKTGIYVNAHMIFCPVNHCYKLEDDWLPLIDGRLLDRYHFRYDAIGPVAFDKYFGSAKWMPVSVEKVTEIKEPGYMEGLPFHELYEFLEESVKAGCTTVVLDDLKLDKAFYNLSRSAVNAVMTKYELDHLSINWNGHVIDFQPKQIDLSEIYG
jgi:hypothetical protein